MAKFRIKYHDDRPSRVVDAHDVSARSGSFVFFDEHNHTILAIMDLPMRGGPAIREVERIEE